MSPFIRWSSSSCRAAIVVPVGTSRVGSVPSSESQPSAPRSLSPKVSGQHRLSGQQLDGTGRRQPGSAKPAPISSTGVRNPPNVAAVKMVNQPPFFQSFAATIRHRDLGDGSSSIEYKYNFTARPQWLRSLLHPAMAAAFRWETRKRLRALRRFFGFGPATDEARELSNTKKQKRRKPVHLQARNDRRR